MKLLSPPVAVTVWLSPAFIGIAFDLITGRSASRLRDRLAGAARRTLAISAWTVFSVAQNWPRTSSAVSLTVLGCIAPACCCAKCISTFARTNACTFWTIWSAES